ncbi:MazG nucleotide pyrophosphohydrolase domain-containing protein [Pseudalkalibacillus caeni]|uniref:NTP pyrophosphohydrolase MazG-like domain-containing protein n=1 Tax=Exobacillus caeni TaxID=2574798 RepID=A0A5R9F7L3_9BACL|nr:MazG nucleotide pyrophosphohydrolase domain-containing protein [Pseudalkalibacillus caeni]TLS36833.1 hypothetical protein FCL54_12815 [Pseudalkalibacillus caeni]
MTLKELQTYIKDKDFNTEMAHGYFQKLIEEVGELSEAIRKEKRYDQQSSIKGTIDEELSDVLYYVLALANVYGVDLHTAFQKKEEINNIKYNV